MEGYMQVVLTSDCPWASGLGSLGGYAGYVLPRNETDKNPTALNSSLADRGTERRHPTEHRATQNLVAGLSYTTTVVCIPLHAHEPSFKLQ